MTVYGFVGYLASGKTTASRLMEEQGFNYILLSDILRNYAREMDRGLTREDLLVLGSELRPKLGAGFLAERAVQIIKEKPGNYVVDSIRSPAEIKELRKLDDKVIIIAIEATPEIRYERTKARAMEQDKTVITNFAEVSKKDNAIGIAEAITLADISIENMGTIEELGGLLNDIQKTYLG